MDSSTLINMHRRCSTRPILHTHSTLLSSTLSTPRHGNSPSRSRNKPRNNSIFRNSSMIRSNSISVNNNMNLNSNILPSSNSPRQCSTHRTQEVRIQTSIFRIRTLHMRVNPSINRLHRVATTAARLATGHRTAPSRNGIHQRKKPLPPRCK